MPPIINMARAIVIRVLFVNNLTRLPYISENTTIAIEGRVTTNMVVFGLTSGKAAIMSATAGETAVGLIIKSEIESTTARMDNLFINQLFLSGLTNQFDQQH